MGEMPRNWEEELLARGIARGEARIARAEACAEAQVASNIYGKWVRKVLEIRFGTLPEDLLQRIASADLAALEAALDRVATIQSLDQVGL